MSRRVRVTELYKDHSLFEIRMSMPARSAPSGPKININPCVYLGMYLETGKSEDNCPASFILAGYLSSHSMSCDANAGPSLLSLLCLLVGPLYYLAVLVNLFLPCLRQIRLEDLSFRP